jgi:hypothetical protein
MNRAERICASVAAGGVVFTTIHKFFPEDRGDRHPTSAMDGIVMAAPSYDAAGKKLLTITRMMRTRSQPGHEAEFCRKTVYGLP